MTTTSPQRQKKIAATAAGLVLLAVAAWTGGSVYAGKQAEAELNRMVVASVASKTYRLTNLNHRGGLLGSDGTVDLLLIDECEAPGAEPYFSARINYRISNAIMPTSLARFAWTVEPTGDAKAAFERLFGGQARLAGDGAMGFGGNLKSDMNLPDIKWAHSGSLVTVSASTGFIDGNKDSLAIEWTTPKISMRGNGEAIEAEGLGIQIDLTSVRRGLGSVALSLDKFATGHVSAEGIRIVSEVVAQGDRLDMTMTPNVQSIISGGKHFKDLMIQIAVKSLHANSVENLLALSQSSCNFRNLTESERRDVRASVRSLLFEGFSAGIQKIGGTVDGGTLDGRWMIELTKTTGTEFRLESVLKSHGHFVLTGEELDADSKNSLITLGFATETPEGLKAEFSYADGILKVNGKALDATALTAVTTGMNDGINAFLAGQISSLDDMASPPAEAPGEDAAEEMMAPTVAPGMDEA